MKSIPRYLTARYLGSRWQWLYTSGWACLRLTRVEPPRLPGDHWVRIRPTLSGICGSDLATLTAQGSTYFSPFTSTPFVLGHEVVGLVVEVGAQVNQFKPGDRVVLEPPLHCEIREIEPLCRECRAGRRVHCLNIRDGVISAGIQTGFCRDTGGGWSRSLVAHQNQLRRLPDDLTDRQGVLAEPFACCLHASRTAPLAEDKTVLILGAGSMGLLTIAAIRAEGHRCRIVVMAKYPFQRKTAVRLGADTVIGTEPDPVANLAEALDARLYYPEIGGPSVLGGADVVLDCVATSQTIDTAMRMAAPGGTVVMVGMPAIPKRVDWTAMWHKEVRIVGSYSFESGTFDDSIQLIRQNRSWFDGFISAEFSLTGYREAIHTALHSGSEGIIKAAFRIE